MYEIEKSEIFVFIVAEDSPGITLNGQSLEIVDKYCYLVDTKGVRRETVDSVITRTKRRRSKFRGLVPLLACRGLRLGAKGRLYSTYVCSVILDGSET